MFFSVQNSDSVIRFSNSRKPVFKLLISVLKFRLQNSAQKKTEIMFNIWATRD